MADFSTAASPFYIPTSQLVSMQEKDSRNREEKNERGRGEEK